MNFAGNTLSSLVSQSSANLVKPFIFIFAILFLITSCQPDKKNAPVISSVYPPNGILEGGTPVTISGSYFDSGASVTIGSQACLITSLSSSTITCTTQASSAGTYSVTVVNPNRQSATVNSAFTFSQGPEISSITPNNGLIAGGTLVTITGSRFISGATVAIGGVTCTSPTVVNSSTITCTTGAHAAGIVNVAVTNPNSQVGITSNLYTYRTNPTVTSVSPNGGALAGGTTVTVSGTGFYTGAVVDFDGLSCTSVNVISDTSLTCVVPANVAGTVDVVVTNLNTLSGTGTNIYTYRPAPAVGSVLPVAGTVLGGTTLTITGTDFMAGATVTVGGVVCTTPIVLSSTSLQCTTSATAAGVYDIVVTNADAQTGTGSNLFTFRPSPSVTSVSPTGGALAGGTTLTITGSNFLVGMTISIGGSACASPTYVNATTLTCITPAHAAGAVDIVVTNTDSQTGTGVGIYSYQAAPTVTSVTPNGGSTLAGNTITINGTGFITGATATVDGVACTSAAVFSSTMMTCMPAAHAAGLVNVVVTNPDSQSATGTGVYTYRSPPTVTSISPNSGTLYGGTLVTITGTGFLAGATVNLGTTSCNGVTVVSATSITCTTGVRGAGTVNVTVINSDTQSGTGTGLYTYRPAPTVTTVSLNGGPLAGGRTITLTGTGFYFGATVTLGGSTCTSPTVLSDTSMTCVTPARAAGSVDVVVTNADTQSGTRVNGYTYRVAPTVTSVTPIAGSINGGTSLTINGTGFLIGATVTIGGTTCANPNMLSSTAITCITRSRVAGLVDVVVTNPDLQTGTGVGQYTYQPAPTISNVSPVDGIISGGTTLTLTGTGYLAGATVNIGPTSCGTVTVVNPTTITCVTNASAFGIYNVVITNFDNQSATALNAFTYRAAPTFTSITPNGGALAGGTLVSIIGSHFYNGSTVTIDGNACTSPSVVSTTLITCTTPTHIAGVVDVVVTNADSQTVTGSGAYTYRPAPIVSGITPSGGLPTGGTNVTITGSNFIATPTVTIGGVTCPSAVFVDANTITCQTGISPVGTYDVVVTNGDNQFGTGTNLYTYRNAPTVTSATPSDGLVAGGTNITITGTGFVTGATVTVGGVACTTPVVVNATTITCTTGAHASGAVDIVVTNTDTQIGTGVNAFTYRDAPTVVSVSPTGGPLAGGTLVTITGTEFYVGATATINGVACTSPTVVNGTTMTCLSPAQVAGTYDIVVTNVNTLFGTGTSLFTYRPAPTFAGISPNAGALAGATNVTVTGTGFVAGASVTIGGVACGTLTVVDANTITCTTGANTAGSVNVVVTNVDSQTVTGTSSYTYQAAPTITNISPVGGSLAGGTNVTITGTGFVTGATVDIGGVPCTSPSVVSSTSLTCTTGAHAAGAVDVLVTNADTQNATSVGAFTYRPAPAVGSVLPVAGPLAGLNTITITGTDFVAGATVTIGGTTCSSPVVLSATSIQCTAPARTAGTYDIVVTNIDTQTGTGVGLYTYNPSPTVTSVSLNSGALGGGTSVTITGANFLAGATVDFGGSACGGVSVVSATSITCTTTAHAAGAVTVTVTNTDAQVGTLANGYTYRAAPTVSSVSLSGGPVSGGSTITITGSNFYTGSTVTVGGLTCTSPTVVNSTTITCVTPAHAAGVVDVIVTNADTQAGTGTGVYTFNPPPTISSVTPSAGPTAGFSSVTITGTNFITGATVTFGGSACTLPVVVSATTITCSTPAHAVGAVSVVVTNPDNQTATQSIGYIYLAAPTVTGVSLNSGALGGGTTVTISGTGFIPGAVVDFGGSSCGSVSVSTSTSLTCVTSAHAAGAVTVTVTNTDGQLGTLASAFTYRAAPTVTSILPTGGNTAGGTAVTITGTGFYTGSTVSIGGINCTGVTVVSATSITCTTGARAAATVDVVVTNADTQAGTGVGLYTYRPAPTYSSVAPTSGFAVGGTAITITGANFVAGATVTVGGNACASVTVVSATSITCTTAAHAAGATNIVVTNTDGQTVTGTNAFTFVAAPTISTISPSTGTIIGGTPLTITGTGFLSGATVDLGGSACASVVVVSSTSITCTTSAHAAGAVVATLTNTDTQAATSSYTYASMADLKWQTGATSPNPPNPDAYGSTVTNITHTYTLRNYGDLTSSTITISKTGTAPAGWMFGTDNCTGNTLASLATCTVQLTFLGQFLPSGSYSASLEATATTGGTTTNVMSASVL